MTRPNPFASLLAAAALAAVAGRADAWPAGWVQTGEASWYGGAFAGSRTSSGERFDPSAMTAAHTTLPLGSRVRVTREDTGASVIVSVNDRLPPHKHRVIDLSHGAASRLGIVYCGHARVTLRPASPNEIVEVAEAPKDRRHSRTER